MAISSLCLFLGVALAADPKETEETLRYLRVGPAKTETECVFTLRRSREGWSITSRTERGSTVMLVTARYDDQDKLTAARATLTKGDQKRIARVEVSGGKAKVLREGREPQEFDVPSGVIVTSAPDWSDTFLLCRHYDPRKGGRQEFPGLWIHPEQPAQRLTFAIERAASETIELAGKKQEVHRHTIRIRNNSPYAAWTDSQGRMIRLVSLPFRKSGGTNLVLEGYEKTAATLRVP